MEVDFWQGVIELNTTFSHKFEFENYGSGWAAGFGYNERMESNYYRYSGNEDANDKSFG